jgi:hypothetical protein
MVHVQFLTTAPAGRVRMGPHVTTLSRTTHAHASQATQALTVIKVCICAQLTGDNNYFASTSSFIHIRFLPESCCKWRSSYNHVDLNIRHIASCCAAIEAKL